MPHIVYDPLSPQETFHESQKPFVYMSGGLGSGKTYSLIMKMFQLMDINKGLPGGLLCPDYKMAKRDVVPLIKEVCLENDIRYKLNKSDFTWYFPDTDSTVYTFSAKDDGDSIRGPNLAWFAINEVTMCSRNSFLMAVGRVRLKKAGLNQTIMSGTPEGFDWAYEEFIEKERDDVEVVFADTRKNPHLSESYVRMLAETYDDLMFEQFVGGKFVNLRGKRAAYSFDRFKHVKPTERVPGADVWVSLDFNVSPMAATLWNYTPFSFLEQSGNRGKRQRGAILKAFDEIKIESSNTYELCSILKEKVGTQNITIYPDPAGKARSTKSRGMSDFDILRQAGYTQLKYRSQVRVRDCLNALNTMLQRDNIQIDPMCKNLISDLEQCKLREGTWELDKTNMKRTHWLDGLKNMVDYEFPIQRPDKGFRQASAL